MFFTQNLIVVRRSSNKKNTEIGLDKEFQTFHNSTLLRGMDHFEDGMMFKIGSDGRVCHNREGDTWADKVLDGVALDATMRWDNCGYSYIEEDSGDEIVGERKITGEVQETTKKWGKEKGEGKFKREKKIPQKKIKKYPTKPKPKNSWHKRLSKVSRELGDINVQTEQVANGEWNNFWDDRRQRLEIEEEKKEKEHWDSWTQEVKNFPGHYAMISVKILVDPDGVSVHDIDDAGVKRDGIYDRYNEGREGRFAMKEWSKLPSHIGQECDIDTHVDPRFTFRRYNFFTYWDEVNRYYIWIDMNSHKWQSGGWRIHFDYYPNIKKMEEIFCLDKQYLPWREVGKLSKWINGIEWNTVWSRMDEIRTGVHYGTNHQYFGGMCQRSRMGSKNWQIPRMVFH